MSLAIMALQILPLSEQTLVLLRVYDNAICVIFLGDFLYNLTGSRPKKTYFIYQRGWLDLLGSLPTLGIFQLTALFRLARLSRLARIAKLMGGQNRKALIRDVVENRGSYATFITLLSAGFVLVSASLIVLQVESKSPDANIHDGGDALWWSLVTITTVGYGDKFPVTMIGRSTAVFVMLAGVGIIGALASILASLLVPDAPPSRRRPSPAARRAPHPRRTWRRSSRCYAPRSRSFVRRSPPGRRAPDRVRRGRPGPRASSTIPNFFAARSWMPASHGAAVFQVHEPRRRHLVASALPDDRRVAGGEHVADPVRLGPEGNRQDEARLGPPRHDRRPVRRPGTAPTVLDQRVEREQAAARDRSGEGHRGDGAALHERGAGRAVGSGDGLLHVGSMPPGPVDGHAGGPPADDGNPSLPVQASPLRKAQATAAARPGTSSLR